MIHSIMANTTQDQEKNSTGNNTANEEVNQTENEDSQPREQSEAVNGEGEGEGVEHRGGKVESEGEGKHERNAEGEGQGDGEAEAEGEGEGGDGELTESKAEKPLDHDQDRRNPQYIPKGGAFYEHDNRTLLEDVENKDPQEIEKKKKVWKESKESEKWHHDWYKESEQLPKTTAEIIETYGYDIRNEEAPPRARRRRKYGRGPDKYERNWEDEQAYMVKQNTPGRRGKKKSFGKDEFPPLPNRKSDSSVEKPTPKSPTWKKNEEDVAKNKPVKMNNHDKSSGSGPAMRGEQGGQRNGFPGSHQMNKKRPGMPNRQLNEEDIKPFRNDKTKWKNNNFRRGKPEEVSKSNKTKSGRPGESQLSRNVDLNKNSGDSDVAHLTDGFSQMTFHSKHSNMRDNRQDSNEIAEQELDSPANRLNPKRYSKNRKGFTGFFPPEEIVEIDPAEMKQLQQEQQKNQHVNLQQQPLNIQNVIRRYPGTYNGNPGYIAPRPIITGIPQQGMSPQGLQQALSPQGIPQQALSPQVPGLQTIELQQGPLAPQPNFVPPMYIDMDSHYGPSDIMGAYTGYAPYSTTQPSEIYQPSGGITYYNTECQNSQIRPPPARRQKAAIPILPPPE